MANEDLSNVPSFPEWYQQKTGAQAPLLSHTTVAEQRYPTFEEWQVSKGYANRVQNIPGAPEEQPGEFSKGLSRGMLEVQALGHGAVGAVADVVGANDFAQRRIADYIRLMEEAEQYSPEVGSIEEIDSPGKFVSWAAGTLGEQIPNIVSIALSGGLGALTGKLAAKQAVKGMAKELVEEQLKNKIASWTAKGALGATYLGASALETGGIFGEQVEAGVTPQGGVALLGGGAAGSLEVIPFITVARRLGFGQQASSKVLQKINELTLPKRMLATGALVSGQEAGTEALQEVIALAAREFVDENYDALGPEGVSRVLNSAAAGALLGFTFGAPGGIPRHTPIDRDEFAPHVEALNPDKEPETGTPPVPVPPSEGFTPEGFIPNYVESPKLPHSELYVLDDTGLKPHVDTTPSEILVNSAGYTEGGLQTALQGLVDRINEEEQRSKSIFLPEQEKAETIEPSIYLGTELNPNKTIATLQKAMDSALKDYGVDIDTGLSDSYIRAYPGRGRRVRALDKALRAAFKREYTSVGGILNPAETGAKAAVQNRAVLVDQQSVLPKSPIKETEQIPVDIPPKEVEVNAAGVKVVKHKAKKLRDKFYAYRGWEIENMRRGLWQMRPQGEDNWTDAANTFTEAKALVDRWSETNVPVAEPVQGLSPEKQSRLQRLQEKERLEGLSEREYQVLEKLLAEAQGEKPAARMQSNRQQEAQELRQLIGEVEADEYTKSELKEKPLQPGNPEEIRKAVLGFLKGLKVKNLPKVKIVNSLDLFNTPLAEKASRSRGLYQTTRDGNSIIYLIEDNIPNGQAALRTLMHELFAHHGLRAFLTPEQLRSFLSLVRDKIDLSELRVRYEANRGNLTNSQFDLLVAEEYVAHIAEDGTNMPLLKRVIAWVKANLRKWFPNWSKDNISFSDEDIRYMLRNVHQFLRGRLDGTNPLGVGVHVGKSGQIYTSKSAAQADSVMSQLALDSEMEIANAVNNLGNLWGVKFAKLFLTPLQIAEKYKIEPIRRYLEAVQKFWASKAGIISEADLVVQEWRTLGKAASQRVAKALFEISEESDIKEERLADGFVQDMLEKQFKLTPEEIAQYWQIDRSLRDLLDRLEKGIKYNAARESLDADPVAFLQEWDSAFTFQERQAVVEKYSPGGLADLTFLQRMEEIKEEFDLMRNRNYFPRMRFGRYTIAVRARNSGVIRGEDVDAKELIHFESFESLKAAKIGLMEIKKEFGISSTSNHNDSVFVQESKLSDAAYDFMGLPPALRKTLTTSLQLDPAQEELLRDVFIKMSPGRSFMKHLRKRKGVDGYSEDAMRVFAGYMMSAANHIARIENFADMQTPIAELKKWESTARELIPDNRSLIELREYFEEHLNYLLNPENDWAQLRALGFLWYLGLNPKSALVNATQVPMVTYPYLAAKFGDARALAAITTSYKLVSKTLRGRGPGVLSEEQQQLFARLLEEGILDESQVMELAGIAEAPSLFRILPQQAETRMINQLSYWGGWMFRNVEKFNRRVAALSAFNLAKESGMGFEDAYQSAKKAVQTTQYEYAKWNRPKFMRGRKSVIFLFWQYLQHTSYLMAGGQGKQIAMRMWLMTLMMSGMMGLPFAEDMLDLIDWGGTKVAEATGMKNPRVDMREAIRSLLVQLTDKPDIIMHGLARYYGLGPLNVLSALGIPVPNLDVSGSLSLGRIVPGAESLTQQTNNPNEKFGRMIVDILGPVGAIGFNMWKALESNDPDVWKKWERAMPIAMKSASRSVRWMARGEETDRTGAQILDFDPYDYEQQAEKVAQFFGFTPTRLNQQYDVSYAQNEARRYWMARRTILLQHFGYAQMARDQEAISDVRAAIRDFNRTAPDSHLRITGKDIAISLKQRRRLKRLSEEGLPTQKRYRRLFEETGRLYPEGEE